MQSSGLYLPQQEPYSSVRARLANIKIRLASIFEVGTKDWEVPAGPATWNSVNRCFLNLQKAQLVEDKILAGKGPLMFERA